MLSKSQENGYSFHIDGSIQTLYGTLTVVSADNLASNALGGFKEGSRAHRYCRQCLGTDDETRVKVSCVSLC